MACDGEESVAEHEWTVLSNRERDLFLRLMDSQPQPSTTLAEAAENYQKQRSGCAGLLTNSMS